MGSKKRAMAAGAAVVALAGTVGAGAGTSAGADGPRMRAPMLSMVSLGDSYSAGYTRLAGDPAEPDEAGKSGCEQTLGSYPYVLRDELAGRLGRVANVTCGGARTDDILGTPQKPTGHASLDRFGIPQPDPLTPFPLRAPQIDVVRPDTDVVTVGIGGNDYFSLLATLCLEADAADDDPGRCQDNLKNGQYASLGLPADDPGLDRPRQALAGRYRTLLGELHARAPHARIYVVGYPTVIPRDTGTCAPNSQELFTLDREDLDWLRQILDGVNAVMASATASANEQGVPAQFVDTHHATVGKDACAPRDTKWVEGYSEKIGVIGAGGWGDPALIHPNYSYHQYVARQLAQRIRRDVAAPPAGGTDKSSRTAGREGERRKPKVGAVAVS
ncbi:SGNH/GDSL hydrolase family protein [Streptomyces echinatus]|uniref:SGNH/GDSL hydrolase family protein n=1 Tax=Streptomyces echinatus TaxID=67293 RepID=UPI003791004B